MKSTSLKSLFISIALLSLVVILPEGSHAITGEDGSVWVGSEVDGLAVLGAPIGRRNGRSDWRHANVSDGLPQDWIMSVACAGPDAAWVGTYNRGVGRMSPRGFEPIVGLEQAWVQDLAVWNGDLWVATASGLFRVEDGVVEPVLETDVHTLYAGPKGLWVGAASGLWKIAEER